MSGNLGNAPLVPSAFGLSPERVRALSNPLFEMLEYHQAAALAASSGANQSGVAAAQKLKLQAEKHQRWVKYLTELTSTADKSSKTPPAPAFAPKLRVMQGGYKPC